MSTVFLHVGQCGNQVAQSFWRKIAKDEEISQSHSYIANDGKYRAVLVDSEPKVIQRVVKGLSFREKSVIVGKRGRGTNWALGYYGMLHRGDDHVLDDTVEAVRMEVERCDSFNGIIMMHSLSGGTGSGLGSRLIEALREEYGLGHLISCAFAPHSSGESPLQHYNSLLTLATLQRNTDCIVLTHNDEILYRVQKGKEGGSISFSLLNESIASHLCGVFMPTDSLRTRPGISIGMEPWEMLRTVCPMPNLKFVRLAQLNKSKLSWEGLTTQLLSTVKKYDNNDRPFTGLANLVIARGDTDCGFQHSMSKIETTVKQAYNSVQWNPFPVDFWSAISNKTTPKNCAGLTIAANSSSVVGYLDNVLERSKVMYDASGYLHWYWKHGALRENFEDAFEDVQTVIDDYRDAAKSP